MCMIGSQNCLQNQTLECTEIYWFRFNKTFELFSTHTFSFVLFDVWTSGSDELHNSLWCNFCDLKNFRFFFSRSLSTEWWINFFSFFFKKIFFVVVVFRYWFFDFVVLFPCICLFFFYCYYYFLVFVFVQARKWKEFVCEWFDEHIWTEWNSEF